jgi:hypothetical protein
MIMLTKRIYPAVMFALVVLNNSDALADDVSFELRAGAVGSDNILRSATLKEDDLILLGGFGLEFDHLSKRVELNVAADYEYRAYTEDAYDNESLPQFDGTLDIHFIPGLLTWTTDNRLGQVVTDVFATETPENRENINSFSTGLLLSLPLGDRTTFGVDGHYRSYRYEESPTDNELVGGGVVLSRALSRNRSISANVLVDDIEYDDQLLNTDYERRTAYVGFDSRVSNGDLSIGLGVNEVVVDGEKADGTLAVFELSRELSSRTELSLSYDQRFSDAGDIFRRFRDPGLRVNDSENIGGQGSPFESKRTQAQVDLTRNRSAFSFSASWVDEDFSEESNQDRKRFESRARMIYDLGRGWTMNALLGYDDIEYSSSERTDDDIVGRLGLSKQLASSIYLDVDYVYTDRESSDSQFSYTENRVGVTLKYAN